MKIKNEKEILDLFVEKYNPLRDKLATPFIEETDKRVWASDGHALIMINQECVSGEYETRRMLGNLQVRDYNSDYEIAVSDFENAIDKLPKEAEINVTYREKTCPECDGRGTVDVDYRADYDNEYYDLEADCPICDGTGTIEEEIERKTGKMVVNEDSVIKIGKGYFKCKIIQSIVETCKMLSIDKVRMLRNHHTEMSIIALNDDVHIVFMPLNLEKEEFDAEIELKK